MKFLTYTKQRNTTQKFGFKIENHIIDVNLAAKWVNEDQNDKFYIRANSVEEKEQSGWGAPPPSNPNGWGQPPPKIGNWQQPPPNVAQPPPQPQQTPQENIYGTAK